MRIIIVDLHRNCLLVKTFDNIVKNWTTVAKHSFFVQEALKEGIEVVDYVTGNQKSFYYGIRSKVLCKMEAKYVLKKNGYKKKIKCITDTNEIKSDDLVVFYPLVNDTLKLSEIRGHKFANVNHFFQMRSSNHVPWKDILDARFFDGYISEVNITNDNAYFMKYMPVENKTCILLPYVAEARFQKKKSYNLRQNKAVALGSFATVNTGASAKEFVDFFGMAQLHPMRKELYDRRNENKEQIDCEIEEVFPTKPHYDVSSEKNVIIKKIKCLYNIYDQRKNGLFSKKRNGAVYYSKDLVEVLNSYKMFIYPEEACDSPALGFVEGMNCGCAYIGIKDSPMYSRLGLKAGVHYIGYDGSYDDLVGKIRYYQAHGEELEEIAENGYNFVKENLNPETVFKRFINQYQETIHKQKE